MADSTTAIAAIAITGIVVAGIFGVVLITRQPAATISLFPNTPEGPQTIQPANEVGAGDLPGLSPQIPSDPFPQVSIRHAQLSIIPQEGPGGCNTRNDFLLTLEFQNLGLAGDTVSVIDMPGASVSLSSSNSSTIGPNTGSLVTYFCANSGTYASGQTVSFVVSLLSGYSIPVAVTVGGASLDSRPQVSLRTAHLQARVLEGAGGCNTANDHLLTLQFQNSGDLPDSIAVVNMPGATVAISGTNSSAISPNIGSVTTFYCVNSATYTVGQTVSFTLRMTSGLTIPVAVTVDNLETPASLGRIEFSSGFLEGTAPAYNITLFGQSSGTSDLSIRDIVVRDRPISAFESGDFRVALWVTEPGVSAPTLYYLCGMGPCSYGGGYNGTVVIDVYSSPLTVPVPSGSQIKISVVFSSSAPLVAGQSIQIGISTSAGQEFGKVIALP